MKHQLRTIVIPDGVVRKMPFQNDQPVVDSQRLLNRVDFRFRSSRQPLSPNGHSRHLYFHIPPCTKLMQTHLIVEPKKI